MKKTILLLKFLFLPFFVSAQQDDYSISPDIKDLFLKSEASVNYLNNKYNHTQTIPQVENNGVFIQQIGDYNKTAIYTKAENEDISIVQNGSYNKAGLFLYADQVQYDLTQNGNNNFYLAFTVGKPELVDHSVTQEGNNLNLTVHGANTLFDKLKFNMQGENRSLIIRNFE